jgi:hypothetical protein
VNAQEAVPMMTALEEMGHKQPLTGAPLETDNSTADGILKAQARVKRSKAFDMRCRSLVEGSHCSKSTQSLLGPRQSQSS